MAKLRAPGLPDGPMQRLSERCSLALVVLILAQDIAGLEPEPEVARFHEHRLPGATT